ncbi:N-terminal glutamine amidase-domain-containing protein [Cristinia sonorae]|uniref:Protein N-terminal glutamine amidohydrolase n=1 Tax=Cristinia sonorae TaxID=1940300 RepID=A0A8K0XVD6_9AGAR|nr:N-terminal glutamine amidase-domain-containing protein [Cristinia sonorae]
MASRECWDVFAVFISNHDKMVAIWCQKANDIVVWDYHVVLVVRPRLEPTLHQQDSGDNGSSDTNRNPESPESWIYDFDTRLPMPYRAAEYMMNSFPYAFQGKDVIDPRYVSLFRVVSIQDYLDHFASDRSHMIVRQTDAQLREEHEGEVADVLPGTIRYSSPPPLYPPLCGAKAREKGVGHNLMESFVSMRVAHAQDPLEGRKDPAVDSYGEVMDLYTFLGWVGVDTELRN